MTSDAKQVEASTVTNFVIIGSGRGLGYALTTELSSARGRKVNVVAISRSVGSDLPDRSQYPTISQQVRYEEVDVRQEKASEVLRKIAKSLPPGPINIIYNSALVQSDRNDSELLDAVVAREIVDVGVIGLIRAIEGFEEALLRNGGCFLGISSASALSYPIAGPLVTYPASKAFMDKMLQALSVSWPEHVRVLVIHLGRVGSAQESTCGRFYYPTYSQTARHIRRILDSRSRSRSYTYPLVHSVVFRVLHHVFYFSWPARLTKWLRSSKAFTK